MIFINDLLSVVLVGDWNKLYIQPDWLASNVFEKEEIEIGVTRRDTDFSVSYRKNGVVILPEQSNIVFSTANIEHETLNNLCCYLNNFIKKAHTPQPFAYGLNACFYEDNNIAFAETLDAMPDVRIIAESGYKIVSTEIIRTLKNNDRVININSALENSILKVYFNEHHGPEEAAPTFSVEYIMSFIGECNKILHGLGYEIEGDE